MRIWAEVLGIRAQVEEIPVDGRDLMIPGGLGREASESMSFSAEFGWGLGEGLVAPKDVSDHLSAERVVET